MRTTSMQFDAVSAVLRDRAYLSAFVALFIISLAAYSYLLSSSSLNLAMPRIAFGLNAYALSVSILISALLSLSLVTNTFAFLNGARSRTKLGAGSIIAGIIPMTLCCTSIIPSLLALLGASTATIIGTTGALQGPFATYETLFIIVSIALLALSVFLNTRSIARCCRVGRNEK